VRRYISVVSIRSLTGAIVPHRSEPLAQWSP
jgi:hypothetical protein